MRRFINFRRSGLVITLIISCIFLFIECINTGEKKVEGQKQDTALQSSRKVDFIQFAGAATCIKCHKNIYDSFSHTGHFLTSQPASEK
ncbi:MAG: hypothetical protein M3R50_03275, partial [Bacteroidota bacterium]|nr:hypothetical protein [Bacteroidota bacterium]